MMRAASPYPITLRDVDALRTVLEHAPQKRECAKCEEASKLQCPACPQGQVCQYTVPTDCTQCAQMVCMVDDSPQSSNNAASSGSGGSSGPSAAPIAGGVIGGVAVIATLTYLVWRFLIIPKRSRVPETIYSAKTPRDAEKDNASRFTHRSSTHTVHSIASTVLTRASNIIQIAYIPGVTNRATPTSPSVLVPPVPPIPMQHQQGSPSSTQDDQRFFVPGNLRDSTYSGISDYTDRTSYAPRSSIASTIYGRQAQVQSPAQTGMRAKPTVVSVRPGGATAAAAASNAPPCQASTSRGSVAPALAPRAWPAP
ncbi:Membrane anchor Opy2 [Ophiocordyceps camponoti-floridani]|uniref:Membrane anchor Opy2 n=1 Tax=Ophiocordyceps camponoti-floridani TaxID=2030778 RepID=A0A8H4Q0E3_9HYPO|nr:Membrane anchor Opy2 [Ophiocordyceps camponoti-floridani]